MNRIALIGVGVISKYYIAACDSSEEVDLVAVCDLNPARLEWTKERSIRTYAHYKAMIADGGFEHAIVCLPNNIHFEICDALLEAGVNVCCEKPLTLSLDEARSLQRLAADRGALLLTAFHRRYNRLFLGLRCDIGAEPIESIRVTYKEKIEDHAGEDAWYLNPLVCGGGCIADNGPNAFDLLRTLAGPLALKTCDVHRWRGDTDLEATVTLRGTDGQLAVMELDWDYPDGEDKTVEVILAGGRTVRADMLEGFQAFKSSLFHEYEEILADFLALGTGRRLSDRDESGLEAVEFVSQCYEDIGRRSRRSQAGAT
jgi:predicted dehydrogenase